MTVAAVAVTEGCMPYGEQVFMAGVNGGKLSWDMYVRNGEIEVIK